VKWVDVVEDGKITRVSAMNSNRRRKKRPVLKVESLEDRIVPSTSHVMGIVVPPALVKGTRYLFLHGSARGTFNSTGFPPADLPVTDKLEGRARLAHLGAFNVSGSLTGTGFITHGNATGLITLSNARGSLTLALKGPSSGGFLAPESGTYTFSVEKWTGAYAHAFGTGRIDLVLGSDTFKMTFHGDPNRF
jgi:hypothetical protein